MLYFAAVCHNYNSHFSSTPLPLQTPYVNRRVRDMALDNIQNEIRSFIKANIESVDQLRILLFLRNSPEQEWNVLGVSVKLYLRPEVATAELAKLEARGFLISRGEPKYYRYKPQSPYLEDMVKELARLDREHPVTLIKLIYSMSKDIQAFADAFKLRKDDKEP
jgi:hypothetical protein